MTEGQIKILIDTVFNATGVKLGEQEVAKFVSQIEQAGKKGSQSFDRMTHSTYRAQMMMSHLATGVSGLNSPLTIALNRVEYFNMMADRMGVSVGQLITRFGPMALATLAAAASTKVLADTVSAFADKGKEKLDKAGLAARSFWENFAIGVGITDIINQKIKNMALLLDELNTKYKVTVERGRESTARTESGDFRKTIYEQRLSHTTEVREQDQKKFEVRRKELADDAEQFRKMSRTGGMAHHVEIEAAYANLPKAFRHFSYLDKLWMGEDVAKGYAVAGYREQQVRDLQGGYERMDNRTAGSARRTLREGERYARRETIREMVESARKGKSELGIAGLAAEVTGATSGAGAGEAGRAAEAAKIKDELERAKTDQARATARKKLYEFEKTGEQQHQNEMLAINSKTQAELDAKSKEAAKETKYADATLKRALGLKEHEQAQAKLDAARKAETAITAEQQTNLKTREKLVAEHNQKLTELDTKYYRDQKEEALKAAKHGEQLFKGMREAGKMQSDQFTKIGYFIGGKTAFASTDWTKKSADSLERIEHQGVKIRGRFPEGYAVLK